MTEVRRHDARRDPRRDRTATVRRSAILLAAACISCADGSDDTSATPELLRDAPAIVLDSAPVFSIGEWSDDDTFYRVSEAAFVTDSVIAVADRGSNNIVWLSVGGAVLGVTGGKGGGPGEFDALTAIRVEPGGLVVWDRSLRRITRYSADGALTSIIPVAVKGAWGLVGTLPDRSFLLMRAPGDTLGPREFVRIDSVAPSGTFWTSGRARAPRMRYPFTGPNGQPGMSNLHAPHCLPSQMDAIIGRERFVVETGTGVITRTATRTATGAAEEDSPVLFYKTAFRTPMSDSTRTHLGELLSAAPRETLDETIQRAVGTDGMMPAWDALVVARNGALWLKRATCPMSQTTKVWEVIGPDGRLAGAIALPVNIQVLAATTARLLVQRFDSLDVTSVQLYNFIVR